MKKLVKYYFYSYTGLPKAAWLLALVILINRSGSIVLFFMTLYLTHELSFSISQAGQIISAYGIGSLIGCYLGGYLSDKWDAKHVQLASLILSGIGLSIFCYLKTFEAIAITAMLLAIVTDAFRPANHTAMAQVCPPEIRTRGYALSRLAVNFGVAVGPVLGGFLAQINYSYLFWVDALTCLIAAILFWLLFHHQKFLAIHQAKKEEKLYRSPWRDGHFLFMLGLILLLGLVFFQLLNTWPLFLRDHYSLVEHNIGFLFTINAILILLIEMPLMRRLESFNSIPIIAIGSFLICCGFGLLQFGNTLLFASVTVIIWTCGEILTLPLSATFIANRAPDAIRGNYMGLFTFTYAVAMVIGPAAGARVYDTLGPDVLWKSVFFIGIVLCMGFLFFNRLLKRENK